MRTVAEPHSGIDVVLRLWTAADRAIVEDIVASSSAEFDLWLPTLRAEVADFDTLTATVVRSAADATGWYYAIEADGTAVGQCSLTATDRATAEIGYWVRSDRTKEGIATRAVKGACAAAASLGFDLLVIRCDAGNVRSAAVALKAGFTHVGTVDLDPSLPRTAAQTGREMTWQLSLAADHR